MRSSNSDDYSQPSQENWRTTNWQAGVLAKTIKKELPGTKVELKMNFESQIDPTQPRPEWSAVIAMTGKVIV